MDSRNPIPIDFERLIKYGIEPTCCMTITLFETLGFRVKEKKDCLELTIPIHESGTKYTPAQLMYRKYVSEIKKHIRIIENDARTDCNKVLTKLKEGNFDSVSFAGRYDISVPFSSDSDYKNCHYKVKAMDIMSKHKFYGLTIWSNAWQLTVNKKDKKN